MSIIDELLKDFNGNSGASGKEIQDVEEVLKVKFPFDYVSFLKEINGGEGMVGENYLMLWSTKELSDLNKSYQVDEYAPGLLLIGSDGGGEAFAFDTRKSHYAVVKVPFVGMELKYAEMIASSFNDFLNKMTDE